MAEAADDYVWVVKWHKDYQPDPHPQVGDIYGGLRAPAGARAKDVTSPCQYWVKGLPGVCGNFSADTCGALLDEDGKYPTGYNNGKCDYLGRRNWCSQYKAVGESPDDTLEKYICIAPDMFRTGLGKRNPDITTHLELIPYPKSEILGYNDDGEGVGQCDGLGMGRGKGGEGTTDPEAMYKIPVVCRHYKPWIMGFGAIKPRPMGTAVLEGKDIYDGSASDPLSPLTRYLPFIFRMLNVRAYYQKCAYWNQDFGTEFEMDYLGGYASIFLSEDPLTECTCEDKGCIPYKTVTEEWLPDTSDTLQYVLTEEKGIVCNGAHSECPCYTGKWVFCVPDNMRDGMRITAEQILELRFWVTTWQTKEIYDSIFAEKSGPSGLTTSDLFTFDKWQKLGVDVMDSVMEGQRIYQCFPIPLNQREFDPEVYLIKERVVYPKVAHNTGTSDSKTSSFPTLIRPADEGPPVPILDVIYPYACKDPWNVKPCDEDSDNKQLMEVASCKIMPPELAAFGFTIMNKNVFIANLTATGFSTLYIKKFKKIPISLLPKDEKKKANIDIKGYIKSTFENVETSKYIKSGSSNKYGYFGIGPVQLNYNNPIDRYTSIGIICEVAPSEYEIVIRDVNVYFYGACIIQDSFEFKYGEGGGHFVTLPASFAPPAKLSGHVETFGAGKYTSVFPIYNKYSYGIMQDTVEVSYCINEYTKKVQNVLNWVRIGPTGYIWIEIDNEDLSYLFDFEVISAKATHVGLNEVCGEKGGLIDLEIVFPKVGDPDAIKRSHLLPNCAVLMSPDPQGFFNEDWFISIRYKYKLLETHKAGGEETGDGTGETVVWPPGGFGETSMYKFVDPPFSLESKGTSFKVEGLRFGTIAVMTYVRDEDERIQAAVATKMLCDVVTTRCRPVEISYAYTASAAGYELKPNSGFFTWKGGDAALAGNYSHYNRPKCGDHDCRTDVCIGPMWFPFNDCTTMDFYSWSSGPAVCAMAIEGQGGPLARTPRYDWRYRMADVYRAWATSGSNWAAACGDGWYYLYSKAGQNVFSGYGKIRTSVSPEIYDGKEWTLPPFGNLGREVTERWLSQEHYGFWDLSGEKPTPSSEYMPLVFDDEMLFSSFNAFEEQGRIGLVDDCLHTTCMLNYMTSDLIKEEFIITYTDNEGYVTSAVARFRFEDLFRVINHAWCMYPPPVYEGPGVSVTARRYSFKGVNVNDKEVLIAPTTGRAYDTVVPAVKKVAWAWREYWKNIGRQTCYFYSDWALPTVLFNFVDFNRPEYYVDYEKIEHRLITDEGQVNIYFTAPTVNEESGNALYVDEDGKIKGYVYSEISIEGGPPRKFEIMYDDYNSEQVEWADEGGDGTVDSSGGDEEKSIYEEAMGNEWFHDVNIIFDSNASAEKSDDRKIVLFKDSVLGDTCAWYNRGVIANMPKDRLYYLPFETNREPFKMVADPPPDNNESEFFATWYNDGLFSKDIIFSARLSPCVVNVEFNGRMGVKESSDWFSNEGIYCNPAVTIAEYSIHDEAPFEPEAFPSTVLFRDEGEKGGAYNYSDYENYEHDLDLVRSPKRMLYITPKFCVRLTLFPGQHLMLRKFNDGAYMHAWPGTYVDAVEPITVWEQKYITSTGEFGDKNPDGEESFDLRSYDRDLKNAGQYFPGDYGSSCVASSEVGSGGYSGGYIGAGGGFDGGGGGGFGGGGTTGNWEGAGGETGAAAIQCKDKMTMIGAGEHYCENIDLDISIGNLKQIEAEEQKKLYLDAYDRDAHDTITYTVIISPSVQQFFDADNISSHGVVGSCKFTSEKLSWDNHYLVDDFKQYDFWQAGGHYFKWGGSYYRTSCYIIGPIETIYSPVAVHYKHGGTDVTWDPQQAYVGWSKWEYYMGKLTQAILLEKGIDTGYDWTGAAGGFVIETFQ